MFVRQSGVLVKGIGQRNSSFLGGIFKRGFNVLFSLFNLKVRDTSKKLV